MGTLKNKGERQLGIDEKTSQKIRSLGFLCALLVVTIHIGIPENTGTCTWLFSQVWVNGVARIAVPFFFVVSGFFLARHVDKVGWWALEIKKRVRTLLIPYVLWNLIAVLSASMLAAFSDVIAHRAFGYSLYAFERPLRLFGLDLLDYPYLVPLWYIRCLLLLIIVSPLLVKVLRKFGKSFLFALFLVSIVVGILPCDKLRILFVRGFSISGCFYFSLGMFIGLVRMLKIGSRAVVLCGLMGLALLGFKTYAAHYDMRVASVLLSFAIPLLLVAFCMVWQRSSFLDKVCAWGGYAFPIYLIHPIVFSYVDVLFKILGWHELLGLKCVVKFFVGCIVPVMICLSLRQRVKNVLFGGRC